LKDNKIISPQGVKLEATMDEVDKKVVDKNVEVKEEIKEVIPEPEEVIPEVTETSEKKEINFSAALKEKNTRIQELKRKLKEAEELNETLTGLGFGETADADEMSERIKTITAELQEKNKELEELKKFKETHERDTVVKQAEIDLENELVRLEKKYGDFDRLKVMGRIVQKKGNAATIADLEESYLAMEYEQERLQRKSEEAVTEGSSVAGVKPPTTKPIDYDDAAERWLQKNKSGG